MPQDADNKSGGNAAESPSASAMGWLQKFVFEYFPKLPQWVQVPIYVLFAVLLFVSIYRIVDGEFAVGGRIMAPAVSQGLNNAKQAAKGYEVRISENYFGTNSKGFYHVILSPLGYYGLWASGSLQVDLLTERGVSLGTRPVAFSRSAQMFDDIVVDAQAPPAVAQDVPGLFSWTGVVAAAEKKSAGARLLIFAVKASPKIGKLPQAELSLQVNGRSIPLFSSRFPGKPAGEVPILPGEWMRYGGDYYFEMESPSLFANGRLILGPRAGFYNSVAQTFGFGDTESFELPPIPAGKIVSVKGTAGGEVQIVLLRKTEVVVFNKGDLDAGKVALSRNGFWVTEKPAPLGPGQTNAIFSGKDVPFQDVQQVIGAIMESGVAIKSVQIGLALKSGRNSEVQIGEDKACGSSALIPPEAYQKMMAAANETELSLAIRPYSCGRLAAAPASPVVNRVGSPGRSNATSKR